MTTQQERRINAGETYLDRAGNETDATTHRPFGAHVMVMGVRAGRGTVCGECGRPRTDPIHLPPQPA